MINMRMRRYNQLFDTEQHILKYFKEEKRRIGSSPLFIRFWKHCELSGGRRVLPRYQNEEMKI